MKLSYLVSPPCKQLSSYLIMASSNVWIPPLNDLDEENLDLYLVLVMSMTSSTLVLISTKSFQILTSSIQFVNITSIKDD